MLCTRCFGGETSTWPTCLHKCIVYTTEPPTVHPVVFEAIDATTIKAAALCTDGAAGPSGIDPRGWRRLYASFHSASAHLCLWLYLLGGFAQNLSTQMVLPILGCRLIALWQESMSSPHRDWGNTSTYCCQSSIVSYWWGYSRSGGFYSTLLGADIWLRCSCACHEQCLSWRWCQSSASWC